MAGISLRANLWIAIAMLLLSALIGLYYRPLMIIDETRYLGVAWEMWDRGSFMVPYINGEPYHHKPPLLFWLIHLNWLLFGVNDLGFRWIPVLFGIGSIVLVDKIYRHWWPSDHTGAAMAVLIAAGTALFAFYNSLVMFDVMVAFFVLLGIYYLLHAAKHPGIYPNMMVAVAIGLGILAKGPVILLHLFAFLIVWRYFALAHAPRHFYRSLFFALLGGIAIGLAWAVPAGIEGGEAYREAIFFGQTANRLVNSFAHQRPFWWYIAYMPLLLFPWPLYRPLYRAARGANWDPALKSITAWLLLTLAIFSFVSGKQAHYLMPQIVLFGLLAGRLLSIQTSLLPIRTRFIGYSYAFLALLLVLFLGARSHLSLPTNLPLDTLQILISASMLGLAGYLLIRPQFNTQLEAVRSVAVTTPLLLFVLQSIAGDYLARQDLGPFGAQIATMQAQEYLIGHEGKYHNQFQFAGRLHAPLHVIESSTPLASFAAKHKEALVIIYRKEAQIPAKLKPAIIASTPWRTRYALLVRAKDAMKFKRE
jgi:4-amino-4-deoxy-L-arabinose transferase-like glycosyltransferase